MKKSKREKDLEKLKENLEGLQSKLEEEMLKGGPTEEIKEEIKDLTRVIGIKERALNTYLKNMKNKAFKERRNKAAKKWRDSNPDKVKEYNIKNYAKRKEIESKYLENN